jgi:hypothetical protein
VRLVNRRPELSIFAPSASAEEAAAVVAAIEQFMRETAPMIVAEPVDPITPWQRAALQEGVLRAPDPAPFWA